MSWIVLIFVVHCICIDKLWHRCHCCPLAIPTDRR